jgi:hypothetical protein
MINILDYNDSLIQKEGIWHAKTKSEISYPEEGNSICYQIEEQSFWFKHSNKCILARIKNTTTQMYFLILVMGVKI